MQDEAAVIAPEQSVVGRRRLFRTTGAGALALGTVMAALAPETAEAQAINDVAIVNFALNFEYLGAELYTRALTGQGLGAALTTGGNGVPSAGVNGGAQVTFQTSLAQQLISQFAADETAHVLTLRAALGPYAIPEPAIDFVNSFNVIAGMAGLPTPFNPFADENSLLQASFSIEDVCVTALNGAAPLIQNRRVLSIVTGFLGVEAYQASAVRTLLFQRGFAAATDAISALRAKLSGAPDDNGTTPSGNLALATIVPSDPNGLVFARTPQQVLSIAYGAPNVSSGGFFPSGVNGTINI